MKVKKKNTAPTQHNQHISVNTTPGQTTTTTTALMPHKFVKKQKFRGYNKNWHPKKLAVSQIEVLEPEKTLPQRLEEVLEETGTQSDSENADQISIEYKHPLERVWTLWYLENDRTNRHWRDMLNELTHIDSVESFWGLYYTIKTPSELRIGCDYCLFKQGVMPMWEDETNSKGGRWLINVSKNSKLMLDRLWLDILLMMVGESFEYANEICGAVVNIRTKSNKISLWTANSDNEAAILEIGRKLKMNLRLHPNNLQYQLHADSMMKINSCVRTMYVL